MKTHLAWRNLVHERSRTAVAAAGVAFAVVLIFMQLGFFGALQRTATIIYDALDFDVCLQSRDYLHLAESRTFPRARLYQAAAQPDVRHVRPFHVVIRPWQNPHSGERRGILAMGVPSSEAVFRRQDIQNQIDALLSTHESVLIDRMTRHEFGPVNNERFGDEDVGVETEVAHRRVRIVGHFELGTGFAANGAVLLNESGFRRVTPERSADAVSLGLIAVRSPESAEQVARRLQDILPADVQVLTREQVFSNERERWVQRTSFGLIFKMGIGVALFVGTAIVYQVLSSDVTNLLPEYATLKAMGYNNRYLAGIVVSQALILAVFGFIPGYFCSLLLFQVTSQGTRIPMDMTAENVVLVFSLAVMMCSISGLGAAWKVFRADPASLF
jgi:putative ABC transport system permease protein